jgi:hypothetical protein
MATLTKRAGDQFWVDLDFSTWPMAAGETVLASNARGALGVVIRDGAGADVSAAMVESAQASGTKVKWLLKGGTAGNYAWTVTAPTSDGELLTETGPLRVN